MRPSGRFGRRLLVWAMASLLLAACTSKGTGTQNQPVETTAPGTDEVAETPQPGGDEVGTGALLEPPKTADGVPVPVEVFVSDEELLSAGKQAVNWLHYHGSYEGTRYWPSDAINKQNVKRLVPKWIYQTGIVDGFETQPIVWNGIMYITTSNGPHVIALDARTGQKYWEYTWPMPPGLQLCCGPVNRGVAIGGDQIFFQTLDAHVVALDARTGKLNWARQLGDPKKAESMTAAPLYYKGKVIVGISGAEYGISGWIQALDAKTGETIWKFNTINPKAGWPEDGEAASRGGGSTWVTGTVDPETNTLYWGIGNPSPDFDGSVRPGHNGYTDSVVALDVDTGELKWWHQVTPHDQWDYDGVNVRALLTVNVNGTPTPVLAHADRNGYFYVIDRRYPVEGKEDSPIVSSDWRVLHKTPFVRIENAGAAPTPEGVRVCPGPSGGSEWVAPSYDLKTMTAFVSGIDMCAIFRSHTWNFVQGRAYWGSAFTPEVENASGTFTAIDVATGKIKWQYRSEAPMVAGSLTTAGGVTFTGEQNGWFLAFDNDTGEILWRFQTGAGIHAQPSAFMIDGKPYIAVASGNGGWVAGFGAVGHPEQRVSGGQLGDALIVFGLFDEE
ncbi:MAG: PQQ-dependent dehydrogenase, methanol/ethanol family [Firmicutes bacterium]|nr:PQQ-dependent dehydrogenase, methanol/ethanol family [Bacillota bacterium]